MDRGVAAIDPALTHLDQLPPNKHLHRAQNLSRTASALILYYPAPLLTAVSRGFLLSFLIYPLGGVDTLLGFTGGG